VKEYILSVDPGLTSGIALIKRDRDDKLELIETAEEDWIGTARFVDTVLREHGGDNVDVVVERFTITQQTTKNSQQQWSIEIIGMIRLLAHAHGAGDITKQSPADAKRFATNSRLKNVGLWHVGGGGHALDALRHALLRLTNLGWRDSRLLHE
jgi:hypothetical protein